jgi:hypothetical protein
MTEEEFHNLKSGDLLKLKGSLYLREESRWDNISERFLTFIKPKEDAVEAILYELYADQARPFGEIISVLINERIENVKVDLRNLEKL